MRQRFSRKYQKIVKRGAIENDEEFYLVKEMVDGTLTIDEAERQKLMVMLDTYEFGKTGK